MVEEVAPCLIFLWGNNATDSRNPERVLRRESGLLGLEGWREKSRSELAFPTLTSESTRRNNRLP